MVMETLRSQVRADLDTRNALTPEQGFPKRSFQFQEGNNWFAVVMPSPYGDAPKGVMFKQGDSGIRVGDTKTRQILYEATLALSDEGKCRLRVNEIEYTFWQFRKMALHDLFFVDKED
jgi:hypothetical protein